MRLHFGAKIRTIQSMKIPIFSALESLLASPNASSRAPIFEQYDRNVQGNTAIERGRAAAGVASVFRDFVGEISEKNSKIGVAIATGGNPNLAKISAAAAAESAVCEGVLAISCVGAKPLAITNCLNFGNPEKPDQMGSFVAATRALGQTCRALNLPIVSGNVSLYNESAGKSVPGSALISAFGRVDDPSTVPPDFFQTSGARIYALGRRSENLGGSEFLRIFDQADSRVPKIDVQKFGQMATKLAHFSAANGLETAVPIQIGGVLLAGLRASFGSEFGLEIEIPDSVESEKIPHFLFSENLGAILVARDHAQIEKVFGEELTALGHVLPNSELIISHQKTQILRTEIPPLRKIWAGGLRAVF